MRTLILVVVLASTLAAQATISGVTPANIFTLTAGASPVTFTVTGTGFTPSSVVWSENAALPTTFNSATSLTCTADASIPQTTMVGAIQLAVVDGPAQVSNVWPVVVGGGLNQGTIVREPILPQPGNTYDVRFEQNAPGQPFAVVFDLALPPYVSSWPTPADGNVLGVRVAVPGTPGWFLLADGIGIFGPPLPFLFFDPAGSFRFNGIVRPNPSPNFVHTLQAVYLDPTAPSGLRLSWPRFGDVY